ncbi:fumarylacetoacetate hydrolase family protein [Notoacmeibacter sp. MSK16QG-6]|uniref:fumarylacetoacetate hydrolase family protein n=1 Tax=Notoacmeibacter sp. MSK16QG-6 TaxID=2957982 RepID=UPI00209F8C58|nr:fumarylacetoacetate hydrolase family protein [Notoacmeibacter sp. MSK16QG-6]MCP1198299.1 fumarylacetoacetate hydrolase family protein [Notoacmeibacter sp. MSK16QG-6]
MPARLFDSPEYPTISAGGDALYPVHRIFCVGRNYADHAREMGAEPDREAPFYFMKDAQSLVSSGATIPYPPGTENYHYEMELVIAIGAPAFKATSTEAEKAIWGYGCGLDMTRRDLQKANSAKQRPWDLGKNAEHSAVMTALVAASEFGEVGSQRIWLSVNGETRQDAHLSDLIHSPVAIIEHLSRFYHLAPGDLIYTGTPAGVGPVEPGDVIHGGIEGLPEIELTIGQPE